MTNPPTIPIYRQPTSYTVRMICKQGMTYNVDEMHVVKAIMHKKLSIVPVNATIHAYLSRQ